MANKNISKKKLAKGIGDGTFGNIIQSNAASPKVFQNMVGNLSAIDAYELFQPVRTAISARATPFKSAKVRQFIGEQEVFDSPFLRAVASLPDFIAELSSWDDLANEMPTLIKPDGTIIVLNPFSLYAEEPANPQRWEDITKWRYTYENGDIAHYTSDELHFSKQWNPSSMVRGNPPLISVLNTVTGAYQSIRWIKSYFGNNATPSGVVNVECNDDEQLKALKAETEVFHKGERNAWKLFWTYNGKVSFTPLEAPLKETPFQVLIDKARDAVMALYSVPPLHGGMWDQTKFDSVEAQDSYFYESVMLPRAEALSRYLQGLYDKFYRLEDTSKAGKTKLTRSMKEKIVKAKLQAKSNVVIVCDIDAIPAVARLKQQKIAYAQKLIDTFKISPAAAAEEVGMDIELSEQSEFIWYKSNEAYIDPEAGEEEAEPITEESVVEEPMTETESEKMAEIKDFHRWLRKESLKASDTGHMWSLAAVDAKAKELNVISPSLMIDIRKDYNSVREALKSLDKQKAVKAVFNSKKNGYYRNLLRSQNGN